MECHSLKISLFAKESAKHQPNKTISKASIYNGSIKKYQITDASSEKEHFSVWQLQGNLNTVVLLKTLCIKDSRGNPKINIKRGATERGVNVISLSDANGVALGETKASYERRCCAGSEVLVYKFVDTKSKKGILSLELLHSSEGTMQLKAKDKRGSTIAQIVSNDETAEMGIEYTPEKFWKLTDDIRYNLMALAVGMLDSNYECGQELLQLRKAAAAANENLESKMRLKSETD